MRDYMCARGALAQLAVFSTVRSSYSVPVTITLGL